MPQNLPSHQELTAPPELELPDDVAAALLADITCEVERLGFKVEYRVLEEPKTGLFDGITITLHPALDPTQRCFILLHLLGHSIQWCAPSLEPVVRAIRETTDKNEFLKVLLEYEMLAGRLALAVLHRVRGTELDRWFSDFVHTDHHYVERYYREGAIPPLQDCVLLGRELIREKAIPPLQPKRVEVRFAF